MNYILFDWSEPMDGEKSFIAENINCQIKEVFSYRSSKRIVGWMKGCISALKQSSQGDTIVCWFDFQAIMLYWICLLTFRSRRIGCINVMLKNKNTLKNKLVAWLYSRAFNSKYFLASVTSVEYGEHLKRRLGYNGELLLIHDVYHNSYKVKGDSRIKQNSVFCGGNNGRDWKFLIDVAKALPDVEFRLVMPGNVFGRYCQEFPTNMVVKHDITYSEFMREMCECDIVALPLDTQAPAGLIVLFQAAANMKYIITTDTLVTREYLADGRGSLLPNDIEHWSKAIKEKLINSKGNEAASMKLFKYLCSECTEEKFVNGVEEMIIRLNAIV